MMSDARFRQLLSGLTIVARKVYSCVPKQEEWSIVEIMGEVTRQNMNMTHSSVAGCLDSLCRSGLIKESKNRFSQVPVREPKKSLSDLKDIITIPPEPTMSLPTPPMPRVSPPRTEPNLVEQITALSQQIAAMSVRHQQELSEIANLVSDMAIEVQADQERRVADVSQLRKLRDVLKEIGV
jgi:hypothetical protein